MTTQQPTADTANMTWTLNRLAQEPEVINALLFTTDGLVLARSDGLSQDDAERAAAAMSGMKSLQGELSSFCGIEREHGAPVALRHVISDMKDVTVLLFAAGERTGVGVSVRGDSMSQQVGVAITATLKMIAGLRDVLSARERGKHA
ncbi:roadblock/LC7 domain-containing protein [Nonomuraea deserti]|uniref:Roadblock/LC7 domain-containing protein n=1 Tax=Nonomuraea deserti TaxID=1848322 RepID=A0A4R4UT34_9ACTN|nr:roadblock/LC7 domain-containing protein [Nonomuraea deserti]TDC95558.1 roadblock/LC7 domain-containing protein [Nonomuraea deserti]